LNPIWPNQLNIDYTFNKATEIRFEVLQDRDNAGSQILIGALELPLATIVIKRQLAKNLGNGSLIVSLDESE
jgi:hypothetical protein